MNHFKLFILWICEVFTTALVSIHLDFDMNDFRVWSLWALSMILGMVQLVDRKKSLKESVKIWWSKIKNPKP
jgi:hypothetical protein